jgi:hypothetical protein
MVTLTKYVSENTNNISIMTNSNNIRLTIILHSLIVVDVRTLFKLCLLRVCIINCFLLSPNSPAGLFSLVAAHPQTSTDTQQAYPSSPPPVEFLRWVTINRVVAICTWIVWFIFIGSCQEMARQLYQLSRSSHSFQKASQSCYLQFHGQGFLIFPN